MDYREHIGIAMAQIGKHADPIGQATELMKACTSCIAFLAGNVNNIESTHAIVDHVHEALRLEAEAWFARLQSVGGPDGKPH